MTPQLMSQFDTPVTACPAVTTAGEELNFSCRINLPLCNNCTFLISQIGISTIFLCTGEQTLSSIYKIQNLWVKQAHSKTRFKYIYPIIIVIIFNSASHVCNFALPHLRQYHAHSNAAFTMASGTSKGTQCEAPGTIFALIWGYASTCSALKTPPQDRSPPRMVSFAWVGGAFLSRCVKTHGLFS